MARAFPLAYGALCYLLFLALFLYLIGFVGNLVPMGIDAKPTAPAWPGLAVDLGLVALFGLQHSIMARAWYKAWLARLLPEWMERSTYVLATNLVLLVLYFYWQPLGGEIWTFQSPVAKALLWGLFGLGWLLVLVGSFLIDHWDLFGLKQVWCQAYGKAYHHPHFHTPSLYRLVRHPMMLGMLLAFWATPVMSGGHLLFSLAMSAYILIALYFEEKDLVRYHGAEYLRYRQQVPRLCPFGRRR
ncbi:methyltransferase [Gallaecimonas kandeliae]|uniref:methanethiol S-methyltransferase n=1 Tax=Gallaecimonas kandeliae TaxID=3029055 RepID=UPI0026481E4D|nr:methanethiol S-methyltransferase [Gallaecimonas kandeliae]WKE65517.1 methyltransferase [Gallaecimonas kandeliae]